MFHTSTPADEQNGALFDLRKLLEPRRHANEAIIRGLCRNAYLGNDTSLCRVLGRYKMFVDTNDIGMTSHLLLDGFWEMWLTEAMPRHVRAGMTLIDAGANLGYFTLLMADLCGPSGRVLAFEPNPAIAARLRRTLAVNGYDRNTTLHEFALGAAEGEASLVIPANEPKNSYTMPPYPGMDAPVVPVRRLDGIPGALDADLIKIDVEGAEESLLRGMTGILERSRPLTIFLEFTPGRYVDPAAFLDSILHYGFGLAIVDFRKGVVPIRREKVLAGPPGEDQMLVFTR